MNKQFLALAVASVAATACSDSSDRLSTEPVVAASPASSLTVRSIAAPEGVAGSMGELRFPVFMDQTQAEDVIVHYETNDGEAQSDSDYLASEGEVVIPAGSLGTEIVVELLGDGDIEAAETIELRYRVEGNATATSESAKGTIANDDSSCDSPYDKNPNPWLLREGANPLNYAHRGGVTDFPENTLYAYYEVAKAGADVLELDVFQTADNELVVRHDQEVDRTTNGSGFIVDLTLAELQALDAAYWFVQDQRTPRDAAEEDYEFRGIATGDRPPPPGYRAEDFRIPTLEEVLQAFPAELINIDLKIDLDGEGEYERQIADLLQRYGRSSDVIAASFVDEALNNFKAAAPCVHTSVPLNEAAALILGSLGPDNPLPDVPAHVAFQIPRNTSSVQQVDIELEVLTADLVADAHAANLAVHVWTINTCEDMLEVIAFGVDAIMTDEPILLEELLNTPKEERSCD